MQNKKLLIAFLVTLLLGVGFFLFQYFKKAPTINSPPATASSALQTPLNTNNNSNNLPSQNTEYSIPLAIVVENHPDSRPQFGLSQADVIYETLAEGGITRFLAIYQTKSVTKIGPVRSARPYFAEFAQDWSAIFAHVGGSDDALTGLQTNKWPNLFDVNEYFYTDTFWRDTTQSAPHNTYTSTKLLATLAQTKNWTTKTLSQNWTYNNPLPNSAITANKFCINFSTYLYSTCYEYNSSNQTYTRIMAGTLHKDKLTGTTLAPANILVQYVNITDIPKDPKLRINLEMVGSGKIQFFREGKLVSGTWKKVQNSPTLYFDSQQTPLSFLTGLTIIALIPSDNLNRVTIK